jgi:hypothetical protein
MSPSKDRSSSTYYRAQAKRAWQKARAAVPGSDMRKSWTEIAASYEKLAEIAERGEGQSGAKPERRFKLARV